MDKLQPDSEKVLSLSTKYKDATVQEAQSQEAIRDLIKECVRGMYGQVDMTFAKGRLLGAIKEVEQVLKEEDLRKVYREADRLPGFQKFWSEYPPRNGVRANKQEAAVSWVWLTLECMTEQIVRSLVSLKETHDWKKDGND